MAEAVIAKARDEAKVNVAIRRRLRERGWDKWAISAIKDQASLKTFDKLPFIINGGCYCKHEMGRGGYSFARLTKWDFKTDTGLFSFFCGMSIESRSRDECLTFEQYRDGPMREGDLLTMTPQQFDFWFRKNTEKIAEQVRERWPEGVDDNNLGEYLGTMIGVGGSNGPDSPSIERRNLQWSCRWSSLGDVDRTLTVKGPQLIAKFRETHGILDSSNPQLTLF
ncbi:MAG: hypothetical protein KDJ69_12220 [Nitratireductor sp.]|nr:hypothetical protein [Nitratireductor sp.]